MIKQIENQICIFDMLQNDTLPKSQVELFDACNFKNGKLHEYTVSTTYTDIVLIICMLHDYSKILEKSDDILSQHYKKRFEKIASCLETGIEYDYEEKLKKCIKKQEKDVRLDENWIGKY